VEYCLWYLLLEDKHLSCHLSMVRSESQAGLTIHNKSIQVKTSLGTLNRGL
jgi:hypothetical protein